MISPMIPSFFYIEVEDKLEDPKTEEFLQQLQKADVTEGPKPGFSVNVQKEMDLWFDGPIYG